MNIIMFNFIDIYSFIPVSGCVGMGPSVLFCPGVYIAVKTALLECGKLWVQVPFESIQRL